LRDALTLVGGPSIAHSDASIDAVAEVESELLILLKNPTFSGVGKK
jgi:hypothetical protein